MIIMQQAISLALLYTRFKTWHIIWYNKYAILPKKRPYNGHNDVFQPKTQIKTTYCACVVPASNETSNNKSYWCQLPLHKSFPKISPFWEPSEGDKNPTLKYCFASLQLGLDTNRNSFWKQCVVYGLRMRKIPEADGCCEMATSQLGKACRYWDMHISSCILGDFQVFCLECPKRHLST